MNRTILFVILLFIISFNNCCYSQYNEMLDSLLVVYKQQNDTKEKIGTLFYLFNATLYSNPTEAKKYAKEQLTLGKKLKDKKAIGLANYNLGIYYTNISELDSATTYYTKALKEYKKIPDTINMAMTYSALSELQSTQGRYDNAIELKDSVINLYTNKNDFYRLGVTLGQKGAIYMKKGNYKIALEESLKSLRMLDTIDKPIRKADALSQLGDIEFELKNFQNALAYKTSSLNIYKKYEDHIYESSTLNEIGRILYHSGELEKALTTFEKSLQIAKELEIKNVQASVLSNKGTVYHKLGSYDDAEKSFTLSLNIYNEINDPKEIANVLTLLANLTKNTGKSLERITRAIQIADSIGAKKELAQAYLVRSELYENINEPKAALEDYKSYKTITDSIFNISKSQQIEELRTVYETERKEGEIAIQKNEIELLEEREKVNNLQRILLGSGLMITITIIILGLYGFRQKIKSNRLEKEKLNTELAFKKKELTSHALHLAKKNEVLENLKQKARDLQSSENNENGYQQLIKTISFDQQDDKSWKTFISYFEQVHKDFNANVKEKYPDVTSNELRLMALLKMNLSSKEIANILNISSDGIKKARQRLRKKMHLSPEDSLEDTILSI